MYNQNGTSLTHYGVPGMKWGVRRYQNYDGSYTKRGVERFKKHEAEYDSAKARKQSAKASKDKEAVRKASGEMKTAKRQMNKAYKQLKKDKLADQGKELYKSGKTITGNMTGAKFRELAVFGSAYLTRNVLQGMGRYKEAVTASNAIFLGGTAVNAILNGKTELDNRKLRAYYSH